MKKLFTWSHRWFGLTAGLYFVLLGLSGSYLVYADDIDFWFKQNLTRAQTPGHYVDILSVIDSGQAGLKGEYPVSRINIPGNSAANVQVIFNTSPGGKGRQLVTTFVDPSADNTYKGQENFRQTLTGFLFIFHHDLFMGPLGRTIVASAGILMGLVLFTGLYWWWPKNRSFFSALKLKKIKNLLHLNIELHKLSGIYSLVLMILITWTGIYITKPSWFHTQTSGRPEESRPTTGTPLSNTDLFKDLNATLAEHGIAQRPLGVRANAKEGTLLIQTEHQGNKQSWIYNAKTKDFKEKTPKDFWSQGELRELHHQIHAGDFWGEIGRFLVFLSGVLPLFFYVSGFYIWLKKPAKKKAAA